MSKTYVANTPLILQDENSENFRVERGEVVELSPEQFEQVAAHVTALDNAIETTQTAVDNTETTSMQLSDVSSETAQDTSLAKTEELLPEKNKRSKKDAE